MTGKKVQLAIGLIFGLVYLGNCRLIGEEDRIFHQWFQHRIVDTLSDPCSVRLACLLMMSPEAFNKSNHLMPSDELTAVDLLPEMLNFLSSLEAFQICRHESDLEKVSSKCLVSDAMLIKEFQNLLSQAGPTPQQIRASFFPYLHYLDINVESGELGPWNLSAVGLDHHAFERVRREVHNSVLSSQQLQQYPYNGYQPRQPLGPHRRQTHARPQPPFRRQQQGRPPQRQFRVPTSIMGQPILRPIGATEREECKLCDAKKRSCGVYSLGATVLCYGAKFLISVEMQTICKVITTPRSVLCYLHDFNECLMKTCGLVNLDGFEESGIREMFENAG